VIAEVIDDEAIIVNLDSGAYYSLRDSACAVWELLAQQLTVPAVAQGLAVRYAGAPADIQAGVEALVVELLREQLLAPVEGSASPAPLQTHSGNGNRPPFQTPVLEKFTDMADLLLLDPIHEVDEIGWPHAAAVH
jgi:hypothetical protein